MPPGQFPAAYRKEQAMSELTMKVTMPVLEELASRNEDFVVKLSHAAAKEIGEKYSDAILKSAIVQEALSKLDKAIVGAQVEAGELLAHKIGEWDNQRHTGYRLRLKVAEYIESHFQEIVVRKFDAWMKASDFEAKLDTLAKAYVERKVEALLKKQVGEFLLKRY